MGKATRASGWVDVIEASYRVDLGEQEWLKNVLAASGSKLDHGLGAAAISYDLEGAHGVRVRAAASHNLVGGEGSLAGFLEAQAKVPPSAIAQTFGTTTCGTASQLLGKTFDRQTSIDEFTDRGLRDTLGINVRDPTSTGCLLVGMLPSVSALSPSEVARWEKVTAHVAPGFRLQRARHRTNESDPTAGADAILTPAGKIEHAENEAKTARARGQLRDAVRAMESARSPHGRSSPESALEDWKGLVGARWSLLDHFEIGGRRYVLARENAAVTDPNVDLTIREKQVLGYAALGHTNKLIAYDLGLSHSTVRVLVARAAEKLGTATRDETVRAFVAMTRATAPSGA